MRNVLVTGGSRGLGLAVARRLAGDGYRVVAVARRESEPLAAAQREAAGAIHFRACDLAAAEAIPDLVSGVRREFGPLWGLVNNAGLGTAGLLATMPVAEIARLVQLNVTAPLVLTKQVVRAMMAEGGGRIVNVASIVAFTGYSGLAAYSASKAAMLGFTRSLAREMGPLGVTVNAVAPGFVATEMTHGLDKEDRARIERRSALRRLVEPEDVAAAVAFLLSDEARNVTGAVLTVDAGSTA